MRQGYPVALPLLSNLIYIKGQDILKTIKPAACVTSHCCTQKVFFCICFNNEPLETSLPTETSFADKHGENKLRYSPACGDSASVCAAQACFPPMNGRFSGNLNYTGW